MKAKSNNPTGAPPADHNHPEPSAPDTDNGIPRQRMEAEDGLAAGIAHTLNNMIQSILTSVEFARESPATAADDLDEIRKCCLDATQLTRQLQAFSRRLVVRPRPVEIHALLAEAQPVLRCLLHDYIDLKIENDAEPAYIHFDPDLLVQALKYLCQHARDAMPEGGWIRIRTTARPPASATGTTTPEFLCIEVSDSGVAIPAGVLPRVFEPYAAARGATEQGGLRLSAVYGMVMQHGGRIEVSSTPGETCVRLFLPRIAARGHVGAVTSAEKVRSDGQICILVAEDNQDVRTAVTRMLTRGGYRVIPACDGMDAVHQLKSSGTEIHLALLDIIMPGLNGRQVYDFIRAYQPHVRVLFSSGYASLGQDTNFVMPAETKLLQKPYAREELMQAIRETLDAPKEPSKPEKGDST